jgi:uncharacterized protein
MNVEVQGQFRQVVEVCRRYPVQRLAVFGSALRDDFDPERSDVDFLVEFGPTSPEQHADAYFGLLAELEALFGRHVDLGPDGMERPDWA